MFFQSQDEIMTTKGYCYCVHPLIVASKLLPVHYYPSVVVVVVDDMDVDGDSDGWMVVLCYVMLWAHVHSQQNTSRSSKSKAG
jgi:hypothetical protein